MSDSSPLTARFADYLALFLVALATLTLEILLTRIFSVTLWYHLAFVAVSIAMFGMTLGAVIVYLWPRWFSPARTWLNMAIASALFGLTAVVSVVLHLRSAIDPNGLTSVILQLSGAYGLITIPFVFSGIVVSLALTKFPPRVSRLYAADLAGAALGCVLLIVMLDRFGGPSSVVAVGVIGIAASLTLAFGSGHDVRQARRVWLAAALVAASALVAVVIRTHRPLLEIAYAKGTPWPKPLYEKWNSYSRVAITVDRWESPFGWGLSTRYRPRFPVRQLHLNIDASAETVLTKFEGRLDEVDYLKHDVTNVALHLRPRGGVYIIGAGGGRDVLSALTFGARRIVAVEMNRAIIDAVNGEYGDVTGHLDRYPGVQFVNDEARSYLARTRERFDLVQISLIDTWAATAAGAFVLSENTLYTTNAWRAFLDRLTPTGLVSVSRWYRHPVPYEVYRVIGLATTVLREAGVTNTRAHLVAVVRKAPPDLQEADVATIIMSLASFSDADLDTLQRVRDAMGFEVLLSPRHTASAAFAAVADGRQVDGFLASAPLDLSPPVDDRPFFFKMDSSLLRDLLIFVVVVAGVLIVTPTLVTTSAGTAWRDPVIVVVFVAIGLGFMLVEISQMLRLTFLLGHPTFSLSAVLFGMLLSSGAGSYSTAGVEGRGMGRAIRARAAGLLIVLGVLGFVSPIAIDLARGASTPIRVGVALALVVPAGFFMGMPFPLAMTLASRRGGALGAWLWAVNGAASVCASVLAVVIASAWGISAAWWTGVACYVVAGGLLAKCPESGVRCQSPGARRPGGKARGARIAGLCKRRATPPARMPRPGVW